MLPYFQQSSAFYFQIPSTHDHHNRPTTSTDPTVTTTTSSSSVGGVPTTPSDQKKWGRKRSYKNMQRQKAHQPIMDLEEDHDNEKKKKKRMEHREIERKRRQEMANLCSSLQSLLPLQFIKGRRSMSDHMNQAVNYIKHLQENIKGLNIKRDELKRICSVTDSSVVLKKNINSERMVDCSPYPITVTVGCSHGGIEILIKSCTKKQGFPISRMVKTLYQEGLDVISCNSTKINERLIHSIQAKVIDERTCIQVSILQQKLAEVVNTDS